MKELLRHSSVERTSRHGRIGVGRVGEPDRVLAPSAIIVASCPVVDELAVDSVSSGADLDELRVDLRLPSRKMSVAWFGDRRSQAGHGETRADAGWRGSPRLDGHDRTANAPPFTLRAAFLALCLRPVPVLHPVAPRPAPLARHRPRRPAVWDHRRSWFGAAAADARRCNQRAGRADLGQRRAAAATEVAVGVFGSPHVPQTRSPGLMGGSVRSWSAVSVGDLGAGGLPRWVDAAEVRRTGGSLALSALAA